jgi:hypothetical protein
MHAFVLFGAIFACASPERGGPSLIDDPEFHYWEEKKSEGRFLLYYQASASRSARELRRYVERRAKRLCNGHYRFDKFVSDTALTLCMPSAELRTIEAEVECEEQ